MKKYVISALLLSALTMSCSELDTKGAADLEKDTCASCHALPPQTGIHHLTNSETYGYSCTECHTGYRADSLFSTNSATHSNGVVNVSYAGGTMVGATCSNIECHGANREDDEGVVWISTATQKDTASCMLCHNTTKHWNGANCIACHSKVVAKDAEGTIYIKDFTKHINGSIERN